MAAPSSSPSAVSSSSNPEGELKIILMGDSNTGKTKLVERFLVDHYASRQSSTFALTVFHYRDSDTGDQIEIWDTAGQERFASLHPSYFSGAHCAVLVFDVERKLTYQHLEVWYNELQQHRPGLPVIVAANKIDAAPGSTTKAFAFPKKHAHCVPQVYFVSAADGTNVVKLFKDAFKFAARYKANPNEEDFNFAVLEALEYFAKKS